MQQEKGKKGKKKTKKERNEKSARRGKKKEKGGVEVTEDKQGAGSAKKDISKGEKNTPFFVLFRTADLSEGKQLISLVGMEHVDLEVLAWPILKITIQRMVVLDVLC